MERCEDCPIKDKIEVYKKAGNNGKLAMFLGCQQNIVVPTDSSAGVSEHYRRTAEAIKIGCITGLLCKPRI